MTLQPDDPGRRRRFGEDGAGDEIEERTAGRGHRGTPLERQPEVQPEGRPDVDEVLGPAETSEPAWVLPAIVLALVALTGSLLLFVLVGIAGLGLWAWSTSSMNPPEEDGNRSGFHTGGPFGGLIP